MHDGSQGNAMTEIARAPAMGFFSLLVLTMVSLGAGHGGAGPAQHPNYGRVLRLAALSRGAARPHGAGRRGTAAKLWQSGELLRDPGVRRPGSAAGRDYQTVPARTADRVAGTWGSCS